MRNSQKLSQHSLVPDNWAEMLRLSGLVPLSRYILRLLNGYGLLLTFLFSLYPARLFAATDVVVYADESYPPYSYVEQGQLKGIYPEILKRVFELMPSYQIQIRPVAWKRGLALLESGQGFALFPPYFRSKERPYMSYSDPILLEETAAFCLAEVVTQKKRENWPDDFYHLRIAVNNGFAVGGSRFDEAVQKNLIQRDEGPGNRSNLLKLLNKRVDCYINDRLAILWELNRIYTERPDLEKNTRLIDMLTLNQEAGYLAYTNQQAQLYPYKTDFNEQFNRALLVLKKQGEIARIYQRYVGR